MDGLVKYKTFDINFHFENGILTLFPDGEAAFDIAYWKSGQNSYSFGGYKPLTATYLFGKISGGSGIVFYIPNGFYYVKKIFPTLVIEIRISDYLLLNLPININVSKLRFAGGDITRISGYTNQCSAKQQNGNERIFSVIEDFPLSNTNWNICHDGKWYRFSFGVSPLFFSTSLTPFSLKPFLDVSFPQTEDPEFLKFAVTKVECLCGYLHYRSNVFFSDIVLLGGTDGTQKIGSFIHISEAEKETGVLDFHPRCIPVCLIASYFRDFLIDIFNDRLYSRHLREWPNRIRIINDSDYFALTCGFEYEFHRIYKDMVPHEEKYLQNRGDVVEKLSSLRKSVPEEEKAFLDNAIRWLKEDSLEARLVAFSSLKGGAIAPFLRSIYDQEGDSVGNIAHRIAKHRNQIAHGKIEAVVGKEELLDFIFLEHLLYLLQLSKYNIDNRTLIVAVAQLFGDRIDKNILDTVA